METLPFFTPEEKKEFFTKYRLLLRNLYSFLEKDDISKMKNLMKQVVAKECYGRDKNGINGLLRNIDTALIATTEIGLKRTSVLALLLYRPVYKGVITNEEVKELFGEDITLMIQRLLRTSDLYARNTAVNSENFHHLLLSFAEDVRVILIMIADRLCMMRLGKKLSEDDRIRLANLFQEYEYQPKIPEAYVMMARISEIEGETELAERYYRIALEQTEAFYKEHYLPLYEQGRGYAYAVCLKADTVPVGYVHVAPDDSFDLGYGLKKEFWRLGIMTEACRAVVCQAKEDGAAYLTATHDVNNPRSGAVIRRIGMRYRYTYQELVQPKNQLVTFRLYQLNLDGREERVYQKYWHASAVHFVEAGL